jgi:large subunit ribosomal protein L30
VDEEEFDIPLHLIRVRITRQMIKITLKRGLAGFNIKQRRTVRSLGLGRVGSVVVQQESDDILGMIRKVPHLLEVERLDEPVEGK